MYMLLTSLFPPLILIFGVLGVLFLGIATPTEASASGAFFAFILYVAYGRFTKKGFIEVLSETAKTSAMVLVVMVGGNMFYRSVHGARRRRCCAGIYSGCRIW